MLSCPFRAGPSEAPKQSSLAASGFKARLAVTSTRNYLIVNLCGLKGHESIAQALAWVKFLYCNRPEGVAENRVTPRRGVPYATVPFPKLFA
jgi:hypothetical protein